MPELKVVNSGGKRVFLMDREELVGAKQNRILNLSILVPAAKTLVVPVSCVEAGWWHHRSREFCSAPRAQYAEGRALKMCQVNESIRATGRRTSDQGEVWKNVEEKFIKFRSSSRTSAMSDIYKQQAVHLEDYVRAFSPSANQVGAAFAIEGKIVGINLFDSPETLRKLFPKLLRSYGLDALDKALSGTGKKKSHAEPVTTKVEAFLKKVTKANAKEYPAVGEGQDLRLTGSALTGGALVAEARIIHLSAFATGR